MSFANIEESRDRGEPITLYHFQYGPGPTDYLGYTDAEVQIVSGGRTYVPEPVQMGSIKATGTTTRQAQEIRMRQNVQLAKRFRLGRPSGVVSLVVRQGHVGDPDSQFLVMWTGNVLGYKRTRNEAIFNVESIATSMRRSILRRHYMIGCPHALYGPECRASKAAATITRTVLSVTAAYITLDAAWATEERKPKYINGIVEWTSLEGIAESRGILKIAGASAERILVDEYPSGLVAGMSVNIVLGCNHMGGLTDDCLALHNNIQNYGGMMWIPTKNPVGIKNSFG